MRKVKNRGGEKVESKSQDCYMYMYVTLKHVSKFFFRVHLPKLQKRIFYIWNRRLRSANL